MELAAITAQQIVILFILILTGFGGVKAGVIKMEGKKAFSDLLIYIIVPAMIIDSYMSEFNPEILSNLIKAFGLSALLLLIGLAVTMMLTIKMKDKDRAITRFACIFSNAAYMGFPLIRALFGIEGLLYASAFVTMFNLLLWTVGYAIVSGQVKPKEVLRNVFATPALISVVIGLVIYLCRIPVPELIKQPINLVGSMNTPLSMIITGMIIAGSKIKSLFANRKLIFVIAVRMLVIPVICFGLFALFGIGGMVAQVVLLLEACPTAAMTSVMAVQFNHDENLAAGAVVVTTFLSILALPVCAYLTTLIV